jgi:hypothetical protein
MDSEVPFSVRWLAWKLLPKNLIGSRDFWVISVPPSPK